MKKIMAVISALAIACFAAPVGVQASEQTKDPDHFINIGSTSKVYTAVAIMQLKEQGRIDLDAPVTQYISEFKMADKRYKDITVRMLMNHTSGLMGTVYSDIFRFGEISTDYRGAFLQILSGERLKADPGAFNCYCNDGFTLLEIIVERVSGMTYTDYIEENICSPLGLKNTGTPMNISDYGKQVPYYIKDDIKMAPEYPQIIGTGGIASTAEDVCKFGTGFYYGNDTILSDASKREMAENRKASEYCEDMGLGWDSVTKPEYEAEGVDILIKGGDTFFQNSILAVAPENKISVAVLGSGGSSTVDLDIAYELMDIALNEQGITIVHEEDEQKETVSKIPEEMLKYAGNYADAKSVMRISFPDSEYMLLESLTSDTGFACQYMYTTDGSFVEMDGDIKSGNAIQAKSHTTLKFVTIGGRIYVDSNDGIVLQKVEDNKISDSVRKAWDDRSGVKYYLCGSGFSDANYASLQSLTLTTDPDAEGYVNAWTIIDEDHAQQLIDMPGSSSRDLSDIVVTHDGDRELLTLTAQGMTYISENDISEFDNSISSVELNTGEATWYKITDMPDTTLTLDIPSNASVFVYDQYGNLKFSSFMEGYGNTVPLPNCGMIVFTGESGTAVGIK